MELNLLINSMPRVITEKNRVQSASSIKTLKQCPRKYFYKYIECIDEGTNIYAIRGKAAHTALENFFSIEKEKLEIIITQPDLVLTLKAIIRNQFDEAWKEGKEELKTLSMCDAEIKKFHDETIMMLMDYVEYVTNSITGNFIEGFEKFRPTRIEEEIASTNLGVRGFIDVQKEEGNDLIVLDYKTSGKMNMNEHLFQLGMYSLLIQEKHGRIPDKAGIIYLKFGGKTETITVDEDLLRETLLQIEQAHMHTQSNDKCDYPKKTSPLCKWRTGQCGFYEVCNNDCN
ncbi:hypothetical protein C0585_05775 [Candidatus Woesearchaeota archaeon]|nr:MAG: hypothetical protein C0585_05775 [Candidatus Woesearchaeota archaeon]